jgi:endonuclease G, mitochondrial
MDQSEKIRRLRSMLIQIAPGDTLESLPRPAILDQEFIAESVPEAVPPPPVAAADADSGFRKLLEGRDDELTPDEVFGLEAIVLPDERPVVFIRSGKYDDVGDPWLSLNTEAARSRLGPLLPSIGRIEVPNMPRIPYGGTGFVVGPNLLMTNRHVAKLFTEGVGIRSLTYSPGDAAVDFKRETDTPSNDRSAFVKVRSVKMIHPYWDMALLEVEGLPGGRTPLKLSVRPPEDLVDQDVVVVGYPARDDRNDLALQDRIFERKYNVKRLQPGKIRPRARIRSFEQTVDAMTHDSSTLGGNSGSVLLLVSTGEIVGLHFAGVYLKANYAVPAYELARDSRVVDTGINFAGRLPATIDWASAWRRVGITEGVPDQQAPPPPPNRGEIRPQPQGGGEPFPVIGGAGGSFTWTIPLQVTISLGQPVAQAALAAGGAAVAVAEVEAPRMQVPIIYDGLEHREGYRDDFLDLDGGETVPLPQLTELGESVAAKLEDGSTELKYHKFSVVMHKGRRLALFTAANVDWREQSRLIDGEKPTRDELTGIPEGTAEQWVTDWRIPEEHQLPDLFFTKDDGAFDKGHIVRRDDVAWGTSFEDMQMSNGDTYHTTNCSPQVSGFNQGSKGKDNWGDLENLVQQETKAEKAITFSGPILAADDPLFNGRDQTGRVLVRIPRKFWKIVLVKGDTGPQAYGFVLEQDLSNVQLEMAVPEQWRRFMRSIAEIEKSLNGLATLDFLQQFDQIDSEEGRRIAEGVAAL